MIALDTNILVYAASAQDDLGRNLKAQELFSNLGSLGAILPLPVIGELMNVQRKRKFTDLAALIVEVSIWTQAFDCVAAQLEDYLQASALSQRHDLQYFDALIITVAARAGATILLSEDMQDGLEIAGLRVVNPFVVGNAERLVSALGRP